MLRRARAATLNLDASVVKRVWSKEEDDRLKELVEIHGTKKWTIISEGLNGRSGKQCRERWYNHLETGVKKGDWSEEEDRLIIHFQRMFGNQWAKITKMLPGRSDNAVKNRFHSFVRAWKQIKKGVEENNEKTIYFCKLQSDQETEDTANEVHAIPCVLNENEVFLNETINEMASKGLDFDFDDGFGDGEDLDEEDPYQEIVAVQEITHFEISEVEIPNDFDFDDGFSDICDSDNEDDMDFDIPEIHNEVVTCEVQVPCEEQSNSNDINSNSSSSIDEQFNGMTIFPLPQRIHHQPFNVAIHSSYDNPALQNTYDLLQRKVKRVNRSTSPGASSPPLNKIQREKSPPRAQSSSTVPRLTDLI